MDEASRRLSKDSLKRFLGVLCHPGASPAPLAEPALAEGGSCAPSPGTREQTPLFSAALGAAKPPGQVPSSIPTARGGIAGCQLAGTDFPFPGNAFFGSEGCGTSAGLSAGRLRGQSCAPGAVPRGFSDHSQWDAALGMRARPRHRWAQKPCHEVAAIETLLPMGVLPGTGALCHVNYFS